MPSQLADAVRANGQDVDGAVMYEGTPAGVVNDQKHWWPQAEGVVGWLNAYQIGGRAEDRAAALAAWEFIEAKVIDREHGEWFAELNRDGSVALARRVISRSVLEVSVSQRARVPRGDAPGRVSAALPERRPR